ncbi:hypothetical protein GUITHDRAFT_141866 [Guillardia theta CCMP2712]|uniref:Solute carrier family 40 member n=1 Tax=Guillardia theta (strain CCMP2712) TaxID=905079 RepID=L1J0D7_GUITC|nr:hypothetical protein GUITHDRAFT_141866 [Guillardia theta CCMP2712]EKX41609.1 hypothetical protein GUITHDRAFT_141866 [Guillardia theta CCMP2712]|eukprot:XP_005828589.1 hypothetical protein GUITHDRAFT_141866 [Guillardia theta CCMP2712]
MVRGTSGAMRLLLVVAMLLQVSSLTTLTSLPRPKCWVTSVRQHGLLQAERMRGGASMSREWLVLFSMYLSRAACDRAWAFYVSVLVDSRSGSMLFIFRTIVQFLFGYFVTRKDYDWLDLHAAFHAKVLLFVQQASFFALAACLHGFYMRQKTPSAVGMVLAGIFSGIEVTLSRHFKNVKGKRDVYLLALKSVEPSQNPDVTISRANALLSRFDLACATLSPLAVSLLISSYGKASTLIALIAVQVITAVVNTILLSVGDAGSSEPKNEIKPVKKGRELKTEQAPIVPWQIHALVVCYSLLFFTVFSPNGLFNMYLSESGMPNHQIAMFGSSAQFCGVIATVLVHHVVHYWGIIRTCLAFQSLQSASVIAAALLVRRSLMAEAAFFCTLSRLGFWGFILCERTLIQKHTRARVQVFTTETSLTEIMSLAIFVSSLASNNFQLLCWLSAAATSACSLLIGLVYLVPLKGE